MDNEKRQRKTLKLWVRISLALIISLGIFLPIMELYLNTTREKIEKKQLKYSYNINKNLDYKVQLYNNNFLDKEEMEKNQVYISELVKNIKLNFLYTYSATGKTNLTYTYDIKAKLYGENNNSNTGNNEKVWEKSYTLLKEKQKTISESSGFNITENLDIDYPKYKSEVTEFRNRFGMNLTTSLKITMNVKIKGTYGKEKIDKTDSIKLEIPLGVQAFSIKEDYKKQENNNIYEKVTTHEKRQHINIICITILIISSLLFIICYKIIFNIKPKSNYTKALDKILKTYGQIIVEVNTPVKDKGLNQIIVKNFEEMIDLEEELRIPIILYENIYNYIAVFSITHNNTVYKYIIKNKK